MEQNSSRINADKLLPLFQTILPYYGNYSCCQSLMLYLNKQIRHHWLQKSHLYKQVLDSLKTTTSIQPQNQNLVCKLHFQITDTEINSLIAHKLYEKYPLEVYLNHEHSILKFTHFLQKINLSNLGDQADLSFTKIYIANLLLAHNEQLISNFYAALKKKDTHKIFFINQGLLDEPLDIPLEYTEFAFCFQNIFHLFKNIKRLNLQAPNFPHKEQRKSVITQYIEELDFFHYSPVKEIKDFSFGFDDLGYWPQSGVIPIFDDFLLPYLGRVKHIIFNNLFIPKGEKFHSEGLLAKVKSLEKVSFNMKNKEMSYLEVLNELCVPFSQKYRTSFCEFTPRTRYPSIYDQFCMVSPNQVCCLTLTNVRVYFFPYSVYENYSLDVLDGMLEFEVDKLEIPATSYLSKKYPFDILQSKDGYEGQKYLRVEHFDHCNFHNLRLAQTKKTHQFKRFVIENHLGSLDNKESIPEIFTNHYAFFVEHCNVATCDITEICEEEGFSLITNLNLDICDRIEIELAPCSNIRIFKEAYEHLIKLSKKCQLSLILNFNKKPKKKNLILILKLFSEINIHSIAIIGSCWGYSDIEKELESLTETIIQHIMRDNDNHNNLTFQYAPTSYRVYANLFHDDKLTTVEKFIHCYFSGKLRTLLPDQYHNTLYIA
ncbi:unnamed protein product [Moneuplotes crassus]|uniref:Uncharacterized protein n=1 Tax=Euplotes crassus TaxID=5936 RepID=A0AAD2D4Y2_EUPCR|nr:unnamed protein product [Moneuplotes crassus]